MAELIVWGPENDRKQLVLFPKVDEVRKIANSVTGTDDDDETTGLDQLNKVKQDTIQFIDKVGPTVGDDILHTVVSVGTVILSIAAPGFGGAALKGAGGLATGGLKALAKTAGKRAIRGAAMSTAIPEMSFFSQPVTSDIKQQNNVARYHGINPGYARGFINDGKRVLNTAGRVFNGILFNRRHDWNSTDPNDILTGFNNAYHPTVQSAAVSLANINTVLAEQDTVTSQEATEAGTQATQQQLDEKHAAYYQKQFAQNDQQDRLIVGTPTNYYNRLIATFKQQDANADAVSEGAVDDLLAIQDETKRQAMIDAIKAIANQSIIMDGKQTSRLKVDTNTVE